MEVHQALSPKMIGASYALLKGDLETAKQLGLECLAEDPFSKATYVLLTYAYSGLGLWVETAQYARLAVCLGVKDERLIALLAGLYQCVQLETEAQWLSHEYDIEAFDLSQALSSEDQKKVFDLLSRLPQRPRIPRKTNHAHHDHNLDHERFHQKHLSAYSYGHTNVPDWLETSESLSLNGLTTQRSDWISDTSDGLEVMFNLPVQQADWLEESEHFKVAESLSTNDLQANISPQANTPLQASPQEHLSAQISPQPDHNNSSLEESILEAQEQAKLLGLGQEFSVAIELSALSLAQENGKAKKLFGPLILALSGAHLIIVAYEGDMLRQKPWAFTREQLIQVNTQATMVTLTVQGNRSISFEVHSDAQAQRLVQCLNEWR